MEIEEKYMRRALQLARLGYGRVSPNPMVGAVIVAHGKIIGEGYHRRWGEAHAEVNAIASVNEVDKHLLEESTMYVTLEPCSHYGKTPPCSKLIIDKKIPRVVVGCLDPYKEVSGRGVKMLRDASVDVVVGVLEDECRKVNRKFVTAHTFGRPYVLLKWAQTADGYINSDSGHLVVSSPITRTIMHRERAGYDAILIGANTLRNDNPSLDVRFWNGNSPLRVVVTETGKGFSSQMKLFADSAKTIVFSKNPEATSSLAETVKFCDFPQMLSTLYQKGVTSIMVEGGTKILQQFLSQGLWDEARVEMSNGLIHRGVKAPAIPDGNVEFLMIDNHQVISVIRQYVLI